MEENRSNLRTLRRARGAFAGTRSRVTAFLGDAAAIRVTPRFRGLRWLSAIAMILFVVEIVSGTLLSLYYYPEPGAAYESVRFLIGEVPTGWLLRSVHHWAGELLLVAVILHLGFVYFRRAYARPREYEWVVGGFLLAGLLLLRFTGRALPWDTIALGASERGLRLLDQVPLVGGLVAQWFRGGEQLGANTLSRFFTTHVLILPWLMVLLMSVHFYLIRRHGLREEAA